MRRMNTRGLITTLESEEIKQVEVDVTAEVTVDNADSLETDLIEVVADDAAAEVLDAQTEEAVEVVAALESLQVSLEACAANGGLGRDAAGAIGGLLEHIYSSVGFAPGVKTMPAMESFGQTSTRIGATTLVMEDIKEKAQEIWKKIKEAIIKSIAWLTERFTMIFGAANKLERRAVALRTKAEGTSGDAKAKEIESEKLVKALHMSGKVSASAIATGLAQIQETAAVVFTPGNETYTKVTAAIEKDSFAEVEKALDLNVAALHGTQIKGGEDGYEAPPAGIEMWRTKEFLGGRALIMNLGNTPAGDMPALTAVMPKLGIALGDYSKKPVTPVAKALPTLGTAEAIKLCDGVEALAKTVQSYEKGLAEVTALKKRVVAAMDKAAKAPVVADKAPERAAMRALCVAVPRLFNEPASAFSVYALNTGKAMMDHVELSLKQYAK